MTGIGVHFALTSEQAEALVRADDPDGVMALIDELEEGADEVDHVASDKAWDAIHGCLSDGALQPGGGACPTARSNPAVVPILSRTPSSAGTSSTRAKTASSAL